MDYEKLFKPYTKDGHTLENTIRYWQKIANIQGIDMRVMELAMNEIFNDLAGGKEFPKDKCSCGCGIDKAATALIHAVRDRMFEIDNKAKIVLKDFFQQRNEMDVKEQIKNIAGSYKEYKKLRPPIKERSPVLRSIRKIFKKCLIILQ